MTPYPTTVVAEAVRTVPPEARHRHNSACYWHVDECRWQCVTYPGVRYAFEHCTAIARPVPHSGPETRP
jgi:hypothetical protein